MRIPLMPITDSGAMPVSACAAARRWWG